MISVYLLLDSCIEKTGTISNFHDEPDVEFKFMF